MAQFGKCSKNVFLHKEKNWFVHGNERKIDLTFVSNLALLTDRTDHLNILNMKLQGPKQVITMTYDSMNSFRCKFLLCTKQFAGRHLVHFRALQSLHTGSTIALERICR